MKRVFCIGNGESRKDFPLEQLKSYGKIYGCNAIYRDYPDLIDVLTAVDNGIIHEIYHSGFALKKPCYFRNWTKLPALTYESTVNGLCSAEELNELKQYDVVKENERNDAEEFVIHGTNMKGMVSILRNTQKHYPRATKEIVQKKINTSQIHVSWIQKKDKSHDIREVYDETRDHGWACGATSGYIACKLEQPDEVYLIGHDLVSDTSKVNNLYKGTKNYVSPENSPTPATNWINQWFTLFDWNRNRKFIKVNKGKDDSPTNRPISEWNKWFNEKVVSYITQEELLTKLKNERI